MHAMKSNLSTFQMRVAASISMRLITAEIMMAESIAFGVYLKRGVITSKVSMTISDITIFDTAV